MYQIYAAGIRGQTEKKAETWAEAMKQVTNLIVEGWSLPIIETPQLKISGFIAIKRGIF